MKLIIIAESNIASKNIGEFLESYSGLEIMRIKENVLDLDKHAKKLKDLNPELVIVASSHKSKAGTPSLTCHTTGNWASADTGGQSKTLSIAPAQYLRECLLKLREIQTSTPQLKKYTITLEVTHHSPSINLPIIFVEVGSSEKEWRDETACKAIAKAIQHIATSKPKKTDVYIGFGGGHYAPTFTRRLFEENVAFGHICPKHQLDYLTPDLIKQAWEKTTPTPKAAVIEWKGCNSKQKTRLQELIEHLKLPWLKDKSLKV